MRRTCSSCARRSPRPAPARRPPGAARVRLGLRPQGVGVEHAEPLDGPFVTTLQRWAAETGSRSSPHDASGHGWERRRGAFRAVNAVVAIDKDGRLAGVYRKVHLYDAFGHRESDRLEQGRRRAPDGPGRGDLTFGVMTCYDLRFPRQRVDSSTPAHRFSSSRPRGRRATSRPTTGAPRPRPGDREHLGGARRRAGREGVTGRSLLVGPDGQVGLELDERADLRTADIDPEALDAVRRTNPSLANRRYAVVPLPSPDAQP
ncbi:nitrilase-related carbon-nitrogen hydrolase [Oerskovia sp. M15]